MCAESMKGEENYSVQGAKKGFLRFFYICICLAGLLLPGLSGCGVSGQKNEDTAAGSDCPEIVVTLQTLDRSIMDGLSEVAEAVNAISVPEIGVRVCFRTIGAVEAFSQYSQWLSNGEIIDLMILNYQDIASYVNKGMAQPLDGLLEEYGKGILAIKEEEDLTAGSVTDGKTYGVRSRNYNGSGAGIWIEKRYLDEVGFDFEEEHIYSFEELDTLWALLKEHYPDRYPLGQITSSNTYSSASYYMNVGDGLGGDTVTGAILEDGSYHVENFYASEDYRELLEWMRKWYLKGYIYPDSVFTDFMIGALLEDDVVMTYPLSSSPGVVTTGTYFSGEIVCLRTTQPAMGASYGKAGFWIIPSTSGNPEAAMKFLNLMLTDTDVGNLISYGIEGRDYVVTDEELGVISYPDGKDQTSVDYYNPMGLYGDYTKLYWKGTKESLLAQKAYSEEARKHPFTGVVNFNYSTSGVAARIEMLQNVVIKYTPILESGSVDLDQYYPEFLKALEDAGVDDVIADKQAQLDAWRKEQEE